MTDLTPARVADPYTPPDVIYLQAPDGDWKTQRDADGVTWCADSVNETDIAYFRPASLPQIIVEQAALIAKQAAEIERLRATIHDIKTDAIHCRSYADEGAADAASIKASLIIGYCNEALEQANA